MAGIDRSTQRVIAVIALMTVAALALRGYIPGGEPIAERERPPSNPAALVVVVAMVCAAVAIIGFAIIARMRDRTPTPARPEACHGARAPMGRPTWRFSLVVLALVIGWLLLVLLLMRLGRVRPNEPSPKRRLSRRPAPQHRTPHRAGARGRRAGAGHQRDRLPDPADAGADGSGGRRNGDRVPAAATRRSAVPRRRRRCPRPPTPAAGDSLVRAAEVGLAEIGDLTREPREAIIACYAAMERELTRVPGAVPQDFDTPSEVLARAVDNHALRADSATELVELFEEARFSPHVMTEAHRDAAVRVLERVLAELPDGAARSVA